MRFPVRAAGTYYRDPEKRQEVVVVLGLSEKSLNYIATPAPITRKGEHVAIFSSEIGAHTNLVVVGGPPILNGKRMH
jgi:hypothetical protein